MKRPEEHVTVDDKRWKNRNAVDEGSDSSKTANAISESLFVCWTIFVDVSPLVRRGSQCDVLIDMATGTFPSQAIKIEEFEPICFLLFAYIFVCMRSRFQLQ